MDWMIDNCYDYVMEAPSWFSKVASYAFLIQQTYNTLPCVADRECFTFVLNRVDWVELSWCKFELSWVELDEIHEVSSWSWVELNEIGIGFELSWVD